MMQKDLIDKVCRFTDEKALFSTPCHVLLGLSGGADSMSLLHILLHWPLPCLKISAIHIHHGLRGAEADRDEAFVRDYCAQHDVALTVVHADVAAVADELHVSLEEAGRRVRYEQFERIRKAIGADYILTAHTATDQAETVLMHIIRGCGVDGLCGIPASRGVIRRPLLCCQREEIEEYCAVHHISFVRDETNEDTQFTRNDVRHRILPALREMNPAVDGALLRLSKYAADESAYLNELAQEALKTAYDNAYYHSEMFVAQPAVIRRRMLRLMMFNADVPTIEEAHILAAESLVLRGNGSVSLPGGFLFSVQQGMVVIRPNTVIGPCVGAVIDEFPCTVACGRRRYTLEIAQSYDVNVHNLLSTWVLDCDSIQGALCFRSRRSGDYLHPAGRGVGKTLKKWMNEWHIPAYLRDSYPILCDDVGVVAVPGYTCDERVCITSDTKRFLICRLENSNLLTPSQE